MTNRHLEHAQMCPPNWAFSVITIFLYSGRWQTPVSTFEKRIRPQFRPFGPGLLASLLVYTAPPALRAGGAALNNYFLWAAGACQRPDIY